MTNKLTNLLYPVLKRLPKKLWAPALLLIFMSPMIAIGGLYQLATVQQVQVTVNDKERINTKESSEYLIFTDGEVFSNTDSLFHLKWNSHDVYANLHRGKNYNCKVYGWRLAFLSMTRNIVNCK